MKPSEDDYPTPRFVRGAGAFDGAGDDPSAVAELHEHSPGAGYYLGAGGCHGAGGFFDDDDDDDRREAERELLTKTFTHVRSPSADWAYPAWRVRAHSGSGRDRHGQAYEGIYVTENGDGGYLLIDRRVDKDEEYEDTDIAEGSLAEVLLAAKKRGAGIIGAGLDFDLTVSKGFAEEVLPPPKREGLPEAPPMGASPEEWNAYFTRLTQRTRELVAKHDAAVQAELDRDAAIAGKAVGAVLGDTIGDYVRDFYRWSSRAGMKIGRFFSGGDPGWNDPAWVEAALARAAHLAEQGYASPPPHEGATRAETDDAIDWEANLKEIERRMAAFWERHPEEAAGVDAALRWGKTNPDHPGQTAIVHSGGWPIPLERGAPGIADLGLVAIARELAFTNGVDPDWMTLVAFQHQAAALARDLEMRKSGEAAAIDAAGYYGTDYLFGDLLAAIVRSIPDAPEASTPDLMLAPFAGSSSSTTPGATAPASGGGAAIAAGLGLGLLLFL